MNARASFQVLRAVGAMCALALGHAAMAQQATFQVRSLTPEAGIAEIRDDLEF